MLKVVDYRLMHWFRRYWWIFAGLALLTFVVLFLTSLAKLLPPDTYGYMAFFSALAALGTWLTGTALAVLVYYQWQLRRFEHTMLFTPRIVLTSVGSPIAGPAIENGVSYPYRIEWIIFVHNASEVPVLVRQMQIEIRLAGDIAGKRLPLCPLHCRMLGTAVEELPIEVEHIKPLKTRWIVEGQTVGDLLDYLGGGGRREFEFVGTMFASVAQDPNRLVVKDIISEPFYIPRGAEWGPSEPVPV